MNTASDTMSDARPQAEAPLLPARTFFWSVRRELWEYRSLYIAPLAVAALILTGFAISLIGLVHRAQQIANLPADEKTALVIAPYEVAAVAIIITGFIIAIFYCLGALHNERRDRSILFWKSLPVSDATTVLSKAFIPLVVIPAIVVAVVIALQMLMLLLHSAGRLANGMDAGALWTQVDPLPGAVVLVYGVATLAIWHAPVYAWLLLVSAWARKAPFLWAVLPPLALSLVEKIAFGTSYVGGLVADRLFHGFSEAFVVVPHRGKLHGAAALHAAIPHVGLSDLDPVKFIASPGVWLGLVFAAAFLAGAVWLRRYREPI